MMSQMHSSRLRKSNQSIFSRVSSARTFKNQKDSRTGIFLYGLGTALPVIAFAFVIAFGVKSIGKVFDKLTQTEKWVRNLTAVVFIGAGFYLLLKTSWDSEAIN